VAGLAVASLTGCATISRKPDDVVVKEKAQARWNALVQGDVKAAYEYFSPGSRQTMTLAEFASGIRIGFWKAVSVDKVECGSADRCDAQVTIEYEHRGMRVKTPHRETWVRDGKDWWFLRK
jgi:hypothetical protein